MKNNLVRIYDVATRQLYETPSDVLSRNVVLYDLPGIGAVCVPPSVPLSLLPNGRERPSDFESIAKAIFEFISPKWTTRKKFLRDLRQADRPAEELHDWLVTCAVWDEFTRDRNRSSPAAQAILIVILFCLHRDPEALDPVYREYVSDSEAEAILRRVEAFTREDLKAYWESRINFTAFTRLQCKEAADLRAAAVDRGQAEPILRKSGRQLISSSGYLVNTYLLPLRRTEKESNDSFRTLVGVLVDLDLILAVDRAASVHYSVYASEAVATNDADAPISLVAFDIDCSLPGDDLKFLISAVWLAKGRVDLLKNPKIG